MTQAPSLFSAPGFRRQFPATAECTVYLDSAATALKPQVMIDAIQNYYQHNSSTIHRSRHANAITTTLAFEAARQAVAQRINAPSAEQIIWTSGTTAAINLAAQSFAAQFLQAGDEIVVSEMEHHSNLVPWLMVAERYGARVIKWPVNDRFLPDIDTLKTCLTPRTKLIAVTQMSNVSGALPDLAKIIEFAQANHCRVLIDGAQGIVHEKTDVQALNADFYCFSAHKLYGPTGVGALYVAEDLLPLLSPQQGGGKMLTQVDFSGFQPDAAPMCFEPGTPNIAGILGFGATLEWLNHLDLSGANHYAATLAELAESKLAELPGFISYRAPNSPILAFNFEGIHHSDLATLLAEQDIALRSGQHCAQPFMQALSISGCLRASFAPYNHLEEVEKLVFAVKNACDILAI